LFFPISRDVGDSGDSPKDARRKPGSPDKLAVGLTGWKFAAPPPVILKERPFLPRMKDLNRRSHP
jgi:hypothetical protein